MQRVTEAIRLRGGLSARDRRAIRHQNGRREGLRLEQPHGCFDHRVLSGGVAGCVERMAMTKGHQQRPRRPHPLCGDSRKLDAHGRDALPLELRADQTHGLVADGSDGNQERDVHAVCDEKARRLRRALAHEASGSGDGTHEREVPRRHRADSSSLRQLPQAVRGKCEVWIPAYRRVVKELAAMVLGSENRSV